MLVIAQLIPCSLEFVTSSTNRNLNSLKRDFFLEVPFFSSTNSDTDYKALNFRSFYNENQ